MNLLTTEDFADPQQPPRHYRRRTAIEERHRQLKCLYDLTDSHSRSFNLVAAQVVFVLLSYTLRQWQLWKTHQDQLAGLHPEQIQLRLRVCAKITSDLGGSATGPAARREGGSVSKAILDRPSNDADGPVPPLPCF